MINNSPDILTIYASSDIYSLLSYGKIKTYIESQNPINYNPYYHFDLNPHSYITVFSGDFISPNKYTSMDDGLTITNIIKQVPIDIVSIGNHEFDIMPEKLNSSLRTNKISTFISTNVDYLENTKKYYTYNDASNNLTIGIIGLCTHHFYHKFPIKFISDEQINVTINHIKNNYNTDFIIGMTHANFEHDVEYLEKFNQIDMILGGHIHSHDYAEYNSKPILRSGENAESIYEIKIKSDKTIQIDLIDISNLTPEPSIYKVFQKTEKYFEKMNDDILFYFKNEKSNKSPRTKQESLPQLICSLVTKYFSSDLTILNSGMFKLRGKTFQGNFTIGEFKELMPFNDYIVIIQIEINDLINGIEYSNKHYYDDGGFLQFDNNNVFYNILKLNSTQSIQKINLSVSTLVLDGIDTNPYFSKYRVKNIYDGIPIHNIISSNKGNEY